MKNISDEDCMVFGLNSKFSRPESMILSVLPVLPLTARPTVRVENTFKSEDDLTH